MRGRSAVVVLCLFLKPCCVGEIGRVSVSSGRRRRSSTFTEGHKREMGRYPDPEAAGLPGFRIGTTIDVFQMDGMSACWYERLNRWVR